jgi:hypothetical protein
MEEKLMDSSEVSETDARMNQTEHTLDDTETDARMQQTETKAFE